MNHKTISTILLTLLFFSINLSVLIAQPRQIINFNENWHFAGKSVSGFAINENISIPHTWNAKDAQEGVAYYRGLGYYSKTFEPDPSWVNKRVFIRFEGVNITSHTKLNGRPIGEHKGGYAAFCYEITDQLNWNATNTLEVEVSNESTLEVPPLVGDFNNYGGIYRPVKLIITDQVCISPLDFASPGVYLTQKEVTKERAEVEVSTIISNRGDKVSLEYRISLLNQEWNLIEEISQQRELLEDSEEITNKIIIQKPHLWNGKKDPYLYHVKVELINKGKLIDEVIEPLGLRYFHIDANEGFFLNDEHIPLRGVSRHQDRKDMGSAITDKEHQEDMSIMLEMGINALRLAHYQHAETIYDIADSAGLVVWAELPWVGGPASFMGSSNGYENTPEFHANAKQQLTELIRQNYNHPSIVTWSIFNEIQNPEDAEPTALIEELNELAKTEDSTRLTVGASMLAPEPENDNIHQVTDAIAWNRYFGWYYKLPEEMGTFLDELHTNYPNYKIGISEYGAGGSIIQHSEKLQPPNPMGSPHPEEWQSYYHEEHLKIFDERPFVWGTFIWNMFDFGSHFRREGDHFGINDKGMVTYDRKTKKDVFYFYKANWSEEPVLHIASKKFIFREKDKIDIKVYTNLQKVKLSVNGKEFESKNPEKGIVEWKGISLMPGNNGVIVTADRNGRTFSDDCVWIYESPFSGMRLMIKVFDLMAHALTLGITGLIFGFIFWMVSRGKNKSRLSKVALKIISVIMILASIVLVVLKIIFTTMLT